MSQSSFESRRDDVRRSIEEQEVREALISRRAGLVDEVEETSETSA